MNVQGRIYPLWSGGGCAVMVVVAVVLLCCAIVPSAAYQMQQDEDCCFGNRLFAHGQTVKTIRSCCTTFTCNNGDIVTTTFHKAGQDSSCCEFDGQLYPEGTVLSTHCHEITCRDGDWVLSKHIQDCCAHCSLYHYGHINTFDNTHYHFSGPCNYSVAQTGFTQDPSLAVYTSFRPCHYYRPSYCLHLTTFKNDMNTVITLSHVQPDAIFTVQVNGEFFDVPPEGVHKVETESGVFPVLAWRHGNCLYLLGSSGLMLQHCPHRLDVWTHPTHTHHLQGLCGHFSFNPVDDMTARNGTVHPPHPFPVAYPESWRTLQQSNPDCLHCRDCGRPSKEDECKASADQRTGYHAACAQRLHPILATDTSLQHHMAACTHEICLLHQDGTSLGMLDALLQQHQRLTQEAKLLLAKVEGDVLPEPLFGSLDGMCSAGSSWQADCNGCSCTSGLPAIARCTRIACSEDYVPPFGDEYCTNGSLWRKDACNVCVCVRNGQVCSFKDCTAGPTVIPTTPSTPATTSLSTTPTPSHSLCMLPQEYGSCHGYNPRWYYDPVSGLCKPFLYSGCGGNANNFHTEADCILLCGHTATTPTTTPTSPTPATPCPTVSCPQDCAIKIVIDPATNCPRCVCENTFNCPPPVCPTHCLTYVHTDPFTNCQICDCLTDTTSPPTYPSFTIHTPSTCPPDLVCPSNCQDQHIITDPTTGCHKCVCRYDFQPILY